MACGGDDIFLETYTSELPDFDSDAGSLPEHEATANEVQFSTFPVFDASRQKDDARFKKFRKYSLTRTRPENMRVLPPLNTLTESSEHGNRFYVAHLNRRSPEGLNTCGNGYSKCAVKFRKSKLIYIIQLLFAAFHFSSIFMGVKFYDDCPASGILKKFGIVAGILGLGFTAYWMTISYLEQGEKLFKRKLKRVLIKLMIGVFTIMFIDMFIFLSTPVSFHLSDENYCNPTFFHFYRYKEIVTFGTVFGAMILYMPKYRHGISCSMHSGPPYSV